MTERKLVGFSNFVRHNPKTDRFATHKFHHVEFYCGDANTTYRRFLWGLGMQLVAKSDLSTGNFSYASYVLKSNEITFVFSSPYSPEQQKLVSHSKSPLPFYNQESAFKFFQNHGLAVKAIGVEVGDAAEAYTVSVANGAVGANEPAVVVDEKTGGKVTVSEVYLYPHADTVLRYLSFSDFSGPFIPGYEAVRSPPLSYGLTKIDHIVGNVPKLFDAVDHIMKFTGFHEFAEFTAEDVGTVDSGLNSMVLANNTERVLFPINEPTHGTPRKSQIQTFLEHFGGAGVQHIAVKTNNIFETMREIKQRQLLGGFEFLDPAPPSYYRDLPDRIGREEFTEAQYKEMEELGLLADKDDQGILLQIFTKPLGDRPTIFLEIIQRVGCMEKIKDEVTGEEIEEQKSACGGFGKGNFGALFKSIEEYEKQMQLPC